MTKKFCAVILLSILCASCAPSKNMAPVYKYGVTSGVGSLGAHTVQPGDSVWKIAQKYNLDLRGIIEMNRISPPYALKTGGRINLPAPNTYTVRNKDNIYTVSRLFNTTQTELAALNHLSKPYSLKKGQVLRIPTGYGDDSVSPVALVQGNPTPVIPPTVEAVALPPVIAANTNTAMPPQPAPENTSVISSPTPVSAASSANATASLTPPVRTGKFLKPVNGKIISSYGDKADGQHNDGINIQAARGDGVRSAENGQVVYTGNEIEGYGNMILIRHADQYMTAYSHLDKILVKKGDTVRQGQTIGTVGSTGLVDKPQLHFEIRKGKKAIDPSGLI